MIVAIFVAAIICWLYLQAWVHFTKEDRDDRDDRELYDSRSGRFRESRTYHERER